jgi:spore maturation protein CgeB
VGAALTSLGHEVEEFEQKIQSVDYDKRYVEVLSDNLLSSSYDVVFSINYIPVISRVCNIFKIKYISWIVDSPLFQLYSDTVSYGCNRIFIFDYTLYQEFVNKNPNNIFYMPLAANIEFLDSMILSDRERDRFNSDISFVGSLYSEKCKYNSVEHNMPEYIKGFVNGLIEAQLKIYGYNLIKDVLSEEFVKTFKQYAGWYPLGSDYQADDKSIVAQEYIGIKCSEIERIRLLNLLSEQFDVHLYTLSDTTKLKKIINKGSAHSRLEMPYIFRCSKINLNITSKTIQSGLSQRIFDVLGSKGFLITNYQPELADYFEIGKDLVIYEDVEDLVKKCKYYLEHDTEREEIALSGYKKVQQYHTYTMRMKEVLGMI